VQLLSNSWASIVKWEWQRSLALQIVWDFVAYCLVTYMFFPCLICGICDIDSNWLSAEDTSCILTDITLVCFVFGTGTGEAEPSNPTFPIWSSQYDFSSSIWSPIWILFIMLIHIFGIDMDGMVAFVTFLDILGSYIDPV